MPRILSAIKQRILSFQGETAAPRSILFGLNRGVRMNLDLASDTQTYLGLGERELAKHFTRLSRGIASAIDCGGSSGFYTLFFLLKTSAKRVVCFEPDDECFGRISANLELNFLRRDARLELSTKFVGSTDGENTVSLHKLLRELPRPCLIKVDVEGAELDVLRGVGDLLGLPGLRWIIETHTAALERDCIQILTKHGLRPRIVDKAPWRFIVRELRPTPHNRWLTVE